MSAQLEPPESVVAHLATSAHLATVILTQPTSVQAEPSTALAAAEAIALPDFVTAMFAKAQ